MRAGVPMLAIPLYGDQLYNALLAVHRGVAIKLDVQALNVPGGSADELFYTSLEKVRTTLPV